MKGGGLSFDEVRSRLADTRRDSSWQAKREALAALQAAVDAGGDWLNPMQQRELAPGLLEQIKTERSALVSDVSRLLESAAAAQGRAIAPLVEKLLFDSLQVAGAGNKTIAKFVRSAVMAMIACCPSPRLLLELHRAYAAGRNTAVHEMVFRCVNVAVAAWRDDIMCLVDKDPSKELCALVMAGIASSAEACRRVGRINFRLLKARYPRVGAAVEMRYGATFPNATWRLITSADKAAEDERKLAAAGDALLLFLRADITPSDEEGAGGPWAAAALAAAAGQETELLGLAATLGGETLSASMIARTAAASVAAADGGGSSEPGGGSPAAPWLRHAGSRASFSTAAGAAAAPAYSLFSEGGGARAVEDDDEYTALGDPAIRSAAASMAAAALEGGEATTSSLRILRGDAVTNAVVAPEPSQPRASTQRGEQWSQHQDMSASVARTLAALASSSTPPAVAKPPAAFMPAVTHAAATAAPRLHVPTLELASAAAAATAVAVVGGRPRVAASSVPLPLTDRSTSPPARRPSPPPRPRVAGAGSVQAPAPRIAAAASPLARSSSPSPARPAPRGSSPSKAAPATTARQAEQRRWVLLRDASKHRRVYEQDCLTLARAIMKESRELDAAVDAYEFRCGGMGLRLPPGRRLPEAARPPLPVLLSDGSSALKSVSAVLSGLASWQASKDYLEAHLLSVRAELRAAPGAALVGLAGERARAASPLPRRPASTANASAAPAAPVATALAAGAALVLAASQRGGLLRGSDMMRLVEPEDVA